MIMEIDAGRRFREKESAEALRRAVVRAVSDAGRPEALALLDINRHSILTLTPGEMDRVPGPCIRRTVIICWSVSGSGRCREGSLLSATAA